MEIPLLKRKKRVKPDTVPSVLIVCDDAETCVSIYNALVEKGYQVHTAVTAPEAIRMLDVIGLPNAIIGDFVHPETDGKAFIEKARIRFGKSAMPPVLFLRDSIEDETTAGALDVHDVLPKPFENEVLIQHVQQLIESRTPAEK